MSFQGGVNQSRSPPGAPFGSAVGGSFVCDWRVPGSKLRSRSHRRVAQEKNSGEKLAERQSARVWVVPLPSNRGK